MCVWGLNVDLGAGCSWESGSRMTSVEPKAHSRFTEDWVFMPGSHDYLTMASSQFAELAK